MYVFIIYCQALSLIFFSRGSDECNKKQPSDCDTLEYRNGEGKLHIFLYFI